jgi:hypothetical protein
MHNLLRINVTICIRGILTYVVMFVCSPVCIFPVGNVCNSFMKFVMNLVAGMVMIPLIV